MKLLFLLVGSALATEWPTESCVALSLTWTSECYDRIGDKDGCNSYTSSIWGNTCEYSENISPEFTDAANGRWLSDYYCFAWENDMKIYDEVPFASKQIAMDACAEACDLSARCRYAMFDWNPEGPIASCSFTTEDCTEQGVYLANSMEGHHSTTAAQRVSVYEKTKQTEIASAGQFTIAYRSSEDACYIDADGCMIDGEGNYDNNEICWFYYTGPGTLTFEEFSLQEMHSLYGTFDDMLRTDNLDEYGSFYGGDSLSGQSVEVTDTQSFGFTSGAESTWPGFKVCPEPSTQVNSDLIETKNELQTVCNESVDNCRACGGRDAVKNGVSYCKLKRRYAKKCKPLKDPICGRVRGCELKSKNKGKGGSKTVSKCKGKPQLD